MIITKECNAISIISSITMFVIKWLICQNFYFSHILINAVSSLIIHCCYLTDSFRNQDFYHQNLRFLLGDIFLSWAIQQIVLRWLQHPCQSVISILLKSHLGMGVLLPNHSFLSPLTVFSDNIGNLIIYDNLQYVIFKIECGDTHP